MRTEAPTPTPIVPSQIEPTLSGQVSRPPPLQETVSSVEPITLEKIFARRPLWEQTEGAAQTPFGMRGSVDRDGRFTDRVYTRDTMLAARHRHRVHQHEPNSTLLKSVKGSVVGILSFLLPNGRTIHEGLRFDQNSPDYIGGFFQQNGKPGWMYNDQGAEEEGLLLYTLPLFLNPQEQIEFFPVIEPTIDWGLANMAGHGHGGFVRYKYTYNDRGEIIGMTSRGLFDSAPILQHRDAGLNTVEHPSGIMIPPDEENGIALAEAQIWWWGALKRWADILTNSAHPEYRKKARELEERAQQLRRDFQRDFIMRDENGQPRIIFGQDGKKKPIDLSTVMQALALSVSFEGKHIVELADAVSLARELTSPNFLVPGAGIRTVKKGTNLPGADNYQVGENDDPVIWTVTTAEVEGGTLNLADSLKTVGAHEESEEMQWRSANVAAAGLSATTLKDESEEEVGQREQFRVREDGTIEFYVDRYQIPPVRHPQRQTFSATALQAMSYNPHLSLVL